MTETLGVAQTRTQMHPSERTDDAPNYGTAEATQLSALEYSSRI